MTNYERIVKKLTDKDYLSEILQPLADLTKWQKELGLSPKYCGMGCREMAIGGDLPNDFDYGKCKQCMKRWLDEQDESQAK